MCSTSPDAGRDGVPTPASPFLGWRIWNLAAGQLESWTVTYRWVPGENVARCLVSNSHACASSPGGRCQCGFWALWAPTQCVYLASAPTEPPWQVMGLISAWGNVVVHGREGFRAERAAVLCLFTDRPWSATAVLGAPSRRGLPRSPTEPPSQGAVHEADQRNAIRGVAARHGVPLVSLRGAVALGLLSELGVPMEQIEAAARLGAIASADPS